MGTRSTIPHYTHTDQLQSTTFPPPRCHYNRSSCLAEEGKHRELLFIPNKLFHSSTHVSPPKTQATPHTAKKQLPTKPAYEKNQLQALQIRPYEYKVLLLELRKQRSPPKALSSLKYVSEITSSRLNYYEKTPLTTNPNPEKSLILISIAIPSRW